MSRYSQEAYQREFTQQGQSPLYREETPRLIKLYCWLRRPFFARLLNSQARASAFKATER